MPPDRRKRKSSVTADTYVTPPAIRREQRTYSRRRKQQVLLFLLHHRITINGSKIGKPLSNEPPIEPGYRRPTLSEAADYFRVKNRTTIGGWWKGREKLLQSYRPKKHTPKWPQLEEELVRLFTAAREKNKIVTVHWLRRTSAEVWKWLYPGGTDVFVFSHGWFWQFLRRAGIIRRRITKAASKPPSEIMRTVNGFIKFVRKHNRR
jgi:hypothetical protein